MGGGAALLLHSPVFVNELREVVQSGRIRSRGTDVRSLCVEKHSWNPLLVNSSVTSRLLANTSRFDSAAVRSTSDYHRIFSNSNGRRNRGRISCSESGLVDSAQEIASGIPPDILVDSPGILSSGLSTDGFYAEGETEVFRHFQEADIEDEPLDNVQNSRETSHGRFDDKSMASALAVAALVSDNGNVSEVQGEDKTDTPEEEEWRPELEQEILDSLNNQEVAASLIGSDTKSKGLLEQMREIVVFAGPALGIWLSGPLMSIIDTAVVGQGSSLELAALGPGTVLCDQLAFVFMFLSIATSNMIATALAHKDEAEAAGHLSRLLFISLFCGVGMMLIIGGFATQLLQAFVGVKNYSLIPAARTYVQIRALAWPICLVGMVSQSASLGMQDSWGPLKVLAIASTVNLCGDIILCNFLGYGIAGAAWATMASQYIGGVLMLKSLGDKGYNPLAITVPSWSEFLHILKLAAPILLTMLSKVSFYTVITYLATSLGAMTLAAHQVMIGIFSLCTVSGEPLAQTAQSFMPALIYGSNRNLKQARSLLRTLILIGAVVGASLGCIAVSIPWLFPQIFTNEPAIKSQMRAITLPFFLSVMMTPPTLSCEGTLLAGRDLKYLGYSMASCFCGGSILLLLFNKLGVGLSGSWWTLVAFQTTRFIQSYTRLAGPKSVLAEEPLTPEGDSIHLKIA